jgi:hypothetical protein
VLSRLKPIGFEEDFLRVLLYGKSGTGKTTLWSTFPGPILAIVCSGGMKPGELRSVDTPENRKRITTVTLQASSEMKDLVEHQAATGAFKTVVIDHVSGLQDLTLKEILGIEEIPAQKSWGLATQQEYGQSTMQCKEILRAFFGLPCNTVVIGQERVDEPVDTDSEILVPHIGVAVTPALANWLNPAVDYNCQTFIRPLMVDVETNISGKKMVTRKRGKGVEYCLRTAPSDVYTTKFRLPKGHKLPDVIVDPTYDKLMAVINGRTK